MSVSNQELLEKCNLVINKGFYVSKDLLLPIITDHNEMSDKYLDIVRNFLKHNKCNNDSPHLQLLNKRYLKYKYYYCYVWLWIMKEKKDLIIPNEISEMIIKYLIRYDFPYIPKKIYDLRYKSAKKYNEIYKFY